MKTIVALASIFLCAVSGWAAPRPGDFFASGPTDKKQIALTFDDGPGPHTPRFLELLKEQNVRATFFFSGDQVSIRPAIAKQVADAGHEIGDHTWSHVNYAKRLKAIQEEMGAPPASPEAIAEAKEELLADMRRSQQAIQKATGRTASVCRMPHGIDRSWIKEIAKQAGVVLVNWTFGEDWITKPEEELIAAYTKAIKPGAILLFHDGGSKRDASLRIAEAVVRAAREQGYEIVPVGQLIGLP